MPPVLRRWWPAVAGLLVLAAVFAAPLAGRQDAPRPAASTRSTSPAPSASPAGPSVEAVSGTRPPVAGSARLVAGPFTDRLRLQRLSVLRLPRVAVTGSFAQLADNSALLDMEVQADFYDVAGSLLGSRKTVLRQPDVVRAARGGTGAQRYGGDIVFTVVAPPGFASRVSSALVSVPVLVNE